MSAVDEYRKIRGLRWSQRTNEQWAVLAEKADAAIAALEAERDAAIDHMTAFGVEACRERDTRIAELEAHIKSELAALKARQDERCGTCGHEWAGTCMFEAAKDRPAPPDQTCRYATSQWKPKAEREKA